MASDELLSSQYAPPSSNGEQGIAGEAKQQVQAGANQLASRAAGQVREQIDTRSNQAGEQLLPFADALRTAGIHLQREGNSTAGQAARRLGDRVEHISGYLRNSSSDRMLDDLERFARNRPWLAGGVGAIAGFMAARFLKASSENRYATAGGLNRDRDWPLSREAETAAAAVPPTRPVGR